MPPSGYDKESVDHLAAFMSGNYNELRREVRGGKHPSFEAGVRYEIGQIEKVLSSHQVDLVTQGHLAFVLGNYKELSEEIAEGGHPSIEAAVERQLGRLKTVLAKFHINEQGEVVERS